MVGNNFGRLFTAISCSRNSGIGLWVSVTESRLGTSKDWHFRSPETQGKSTISTRNHLLHQEWQEILIRVYLSQQLTNYDTHRFAKQLLPTLTVKDESYIYDFLLNSSSSDHIFIVVIPFEHHTMPVERKHKFHRNTLSKYFITIPLFRTRQDTARNTRKSVSKLWQTKVLQTRSR